MPVANRTTDAEICAVADSESRIVITKDADFVNSHELNGTPARLLLISTGNISNSELLELWRRHLAQIIRALDDSPFIELGSGHLVVRG